VTVAAAGGGFDDPSEDVLAQAAAAFGLPASPARPHIVRALAQADAGPRVLAVATADRPAGARTADAGA
jgi:hypothetical protein